MNKIVLGGIIIAVVAIGGFAVHSQSVVKKEAALMAKEKMEKEQMVQEEAMKKAGDDSITKGVDQAVEKTDDAMVKEDDSMVQKDEKKMEATDSSMMKKDDTAMMKVGSYEVYSASKIAMASDSHDVVLFFRASWCPSCKAVDADIKAHLQDIPATLTVLDVDYDNSAELKQKYGVTYQHTFVQVDAQGNLIAKWSGSPTLSSLVAKVQ